VGRWVGRVMRENVVGVLGVGFFVCVFLVLVVVEMEAWCLGRVDGMDGLRGLVYRYADEKREISS